LIANFRNFKGKEKAFLPKQISNPYIQDRNVGEVIEWNVEIMK